MSSAYARAEALIRQHVDKLNPLAKQLLEREMLTYDDVVSILGPRPFKSEHPFRLTAKPADDKP